MIRSRLIWISTVCKRMFEFTWCPTLPYWLVECHECYRVKSGDLGHRVNADSDLVYFIFLFWNEKYITKQTVKLLMRRRRRIIWIFTVCKGMSPFTWGPKLPDFTLLITDLCCSMVEQQNFSVLRIQ